MCQIGDFFSEEAALWWLQFQIVFSTSVKNDMYVVEVFFSCL